MIEKHINFNVTQCSMTEVIGILREQKEIDKISKDNAINMSLLKQFLLLAGKGYNNTVIAQKLGVHRITVQRYASTLRSMKHSDYVKLVNYMFVESNNERGKK